MLRRIFLVEPVSVTPSEQTHCAKNKNRRNQEDKDTRTQRVDGTSSGRGCGVITHRAALGRR
jgi:hypothetical protein